MRLSPDEVVITHEIYVIPRRIAEIIGQITASYSFLEYTLHECVRLIANIDRKTYRIGFRSPRACEIVDMIADFANARSLDLDCDLANLKGLCTIAQSGRDGYAHALWVKVKGSKDVYTRKSKTGRFPKSHPFAGIPFTQIMKLSDPVTVKMLQSVRSTILEAIRIARKLEKDLDAGRYASPDKSRKSQHQYRVLRSLTKKHHARV